MIPDDKFLISLKQERGIRIYHERPLFSSCLPESVTQVRFHRFRISIKMDFLFSSDKKSTRTSQVRFSGCQTEEGLMNTISGGEDLKLTSRLEVPIPRLM